MITKQEIFNKALFGIREQNYKRSMKNVGELHEACAYRGEGGLKCAIGHCLPDALALACDASAHGASIEYLLSIDPDTLDDPMQQELREVLGVTNLSIDVRFLSYLQDTHDCMETPRGFETEMQSIAAQYDLEYTPNAVI